MCQAASWGSGYQCWPHGNGAVGDPLVATDMIIATNSLSREVSKNTQFGSPGSHAQQHV